MGLRIAGVRHEVDIHVGRRVAKLRLRRRQSQSDLGDALGLSFQQVQKYEKGSNRISASKLWDIARFLGVEIGYFFEGLGPAPGQASPAAPSTAATTHTAAINSLTPSLGLRQQKLALELVRSMRARDSDPPSGTAVGDSGLRPLANVLPSFSAGATRAMTGI